MFSLIIQNEYYFYNDIDDKLNEKDICFICWLPNEEDNEIKQLSEFSHINIICKCNPKIHQLCLNNWISQNLSCPSCPICRRKINLDQTHLKSYYKIFKHNNLIKLIFYVNIIYFIYIFCNNIYILTFFDNLSFQ